MRSPTSPCATARPVRAVQGRPAQAHARARSPAAARGWPKASSRASWLAGGRAGPGVRAGRGSRPAGRPARVSCASVAGRPLIQAREPPSARITRRSWQSSSSSQFVLAQPGQRRPGHRARSNSAASSARSAPWRTMPASARGAGQAAAAHRPAATCRRRFRRRPRSGPRPNASSAALTTAKSLRVRWSSMGARFCLKWHVAAAQAHAVGRSSGTLRLANALAPAAGYGLSMRHRACPSIPRARHLLRTLIAQYIRDGEPVGSQHAGAQCRAWTSARPRSATSWPTWRTSACWRRRIPRPGASRPRRATACSSTRLLQMQPLAEARNGRGCAPSCRPAPAPRRCWRNASELLSAMTHFVGVVTRAAARAVRVPPHRFRAAGRPAACW